MYDIYYGDSKMTLKKVSIQEFAQRHSNIGNKRHRQHKKIDIAAEIKVPENKNRAYFALQKLIEIHPNYLCKEFYTDNLSYKLYYVGGKRLFVTDSPAQLNFMVNKFQRKFPSIKIAVISQ